MSCVWSFDDNDDEERGGEEAGGGGGGGGEEEQEESQTWQLQCHDITSQPRFLQKPQTILNYTVKCCAVPSLTFLHLHR